VQDAYRRLGLPLAPDFAAALNRATAPARAYRSGHKYDLAQFGLEPAAIERRFAGAYMQRPAMAFDTDDLTSSGVRDDTSPVVPAVQQTAAAEGCS
jgi:hypothetical protein